MGLEISDLGLVSAEVPGLLLPLPRHLRYPQCLSAVASAIVVASIELFVVRQRDCY